MKWSFNKMASLGKKDLKTAPLYLGKKNNLSRLKEASSSKDVELILKDIKTAALKKVDLISERQNRKNCRKDSHSKNGGTGHESQEDSPPVNTDQTRFLKQNGNSYIFKNSNGCSDNKKKHSQNGTKNGVSALINEKQNSSICDDVSENINQTCKIVEDSCLQNEEITFHSQEIMHSKENEKGPNNSEKKEIDKHGIDVLREEKVLSKNKNLTDLEKSEMMKDGILVNEMISSKTDKNGIEEETTSENRQHVNSKVEVIEEIIPENKMLQNPAEGLVLSENSIAKKQPETIATMSDKEPTDSENEDKDFTSSISEEEDPMVEGICIIINGKRLPPSSELQLENLRNSKERLTIAGKDGTDLNQSEVSVFESIEHTLNVSESTESALNVSDQESTQQNSTDQSNTDIKTDILSAILDMTNKTKPEDNKILDGLDTLTRNKRSLRPIIHNFLGDLRHKPARTQSLTVKSVTFSQDTVFNEDKTKRYRKERASLRNVCRNRIGGFETYGKINPLFEDDSDEGESYARVNPKSSLKRKGSFIYHGDDQNSSAENSDDDSSIDKTVLNFPSYMQKFLQNNSNLTAAVAKINTEDSFESQVSEIENSLNDQSNENVMLSSNSRGKPESVEIPKIVITNADEDEGHLTLASQVPGYDVLIKKTIAKQQHHFFMKCSITFLFVCGLLAIIAIIVYFLIIKR